MGTVKQKYSNPLLQLYDINKRFICNLTNRNLRNSAYSIKKKLTTNDVKILTFCIPFDNEYIHNNSCEYLIKFEFDWYIIKSITLSSEEVSVLEVTCEDEFSISKTVLCSPLELIGCSPKEMFDGIMGATGSVTLDYKFKGTDVVSNRSIVVEDESSVFENLIKMAEAFDGIIEMSTDTYGQKWIFLRKEPYNRGKIARKGYDTTSININYNTGEIFTRLMPFGEKDDYGIEVNIGDVNPTGKLYIENYEYYEGKGLTYEEIMSNPQCQAMTVRRYENVYTPEELLSVATEELNRLSKPTVTGNLTLCDLSVLEDSSMIEPLIYEKIIVVDEKTKMRFESLIQDIEYDYDNILNSSITLNNTITYNSIFKDLVTQGEKIDKVITTNPITGQTSIIAGSIQGKINSAVTQIGTMLDTIESPESDYAILFEDRREGSNLYGALAVGTKGILIAHELKEDNTWNWATAINSLGINASEITTGTLWADMIKAGTLSDVNHTSWINLEDGTFSFANGQLTFDGSEFIVKIGSQEIEDSLTSLFNIVMNKEHQIITVDTNSYPVNSGEYTFTFRVLKGNTTTETPCLVKNITPSKEIEGISFTFNGNSCIMKVDKTKRLLGITEEYFDVELEILDYVLHKTITWSTVSQGRDGQDGINGTPGISSYFHIKYAPVINPTVEQMTEEVNTYIGTYVDNIEEDSLDPSKYTWSKFIGSDGQDGIPGTNGVDGQTSYLHIKYSDDLVHFTENNGETPGKYMGQYVDFVAEDSNDFKKYVWAQIKGDDGVNGTPGISSYFHVKYSPVPNPTADQMTETVDTYIGTYVDHTKEDSNDPNKYTWVKLIGEDGADGISGVDGVDGKTTYLHIKYSDDMVSFTENNGETPGKYMGQYVDFVEEDSLVFNDYIWSQIRGEDGKDGTNGINGTPGISSYFHVKYAPNNHPTASQMTDTPQEYIGTYVDSNVEDSNDPSKYTWIKIQGQDGTSITIDYTVVELPETGVIGKYYYVSTTGVLWRYTEDGWFALGKIQGEQGIPGRDGADGKTQYLHIKYSNDGGLTFTANNGEEVGMYIGTYVDFNENDSASVSDYKWARMKGEDGKSASHVAIMETTKLFMMPKESKSYTPNTITLTPVFTNCTYGKWQYSVDNGSTWVNVTSGNNGLTINNKALTVASTSNLYTDTINSISFKVTASDGSFDISTISRLKDGIDGVDGENGISATNVILGNENHTFQGTSDGKAVATSITFDIDGYVGTTEKEVTVGSISNVPIGMTVVANGSGTKNATIRINVTDSMTSLNGVITIPVTCNNLTFNKQFTYSLSVPGKDGQDGINGTNGIDGTSSYFHIKYSPVPNPTASQMTEDVNIYIGTYVDNSPNDSNNPSDYTWSKFIGQDGNNGADGTPGKDGKDGTTYYLHIKYSNDGSTFTSNNGETPGDYLGQYVDTIKEDSMTFSKYTWKKIKGEDGEQGIPGVNGTSSYFHIKYAPNSNPTSEQMSETVQEYIGTYVDDNPVDSIDPKKYTWSKFMGKDGNNGVNGTPGKDGKDGTTYYLHIKYSNDGKTFTDNNGETPGSYLGQYVDATQSDSMVFSDYTWSKIKGEDGKDGVNGTPGVSSYFHVKYAPNNNPSASEMTDTPQEYIGTYVDNNSADSTDPKKYTWIKIQGSDGTSITIDYTVTTLPTTGEVGKYYYVSSTGVLWRYEEAGWIELGKIQGPQGIPGKDGTNGKTSYLHIKYSNDGGATFTTNNGEDVGMYIGTYVDFNENDSNSVSSYKWARMKGENGTSASYVKIVESARIFAKPQGAKDYSPSTITLTPELTNCTFNKWQYSTNGGSSWTNVTSGSNGLTVDSGVLTISKDSPLFTSSTTSVSFKVTASDGSSDVSTIARLTDGINGINGIDGINGVDGVTPAFNQASGTKEPKSLVGNNTTNQCKDLYHVNYNNIAGKKITISFDWEVTGDTKSGAFRIQTTGGNYWVSLSETITVSDTNCSGHYTNTRTLSSDASVCTDASLRLDNFQGTFTISKFKIELNDKESAWLPTVEELKGESATNVILGNENHTFQATSDGKAVANTITFEVDGFVGTTEKEVTIGSISGAPTGMTVTSSGSGSTSATITVKVTTAMSKLNGIINIPVTCNGLTFNKQFTYSLAVPGRDGEDGLNGTNGIDGTSSYFHIKYAPNGNPTSAQMTETVQEYIGTYVDNSPTDSTDPKKYTWSKFVGKDGNNGTNGTPGKDGKDGVTYYLHIKYSNDGATFTSNNGETPGDYLGQYVDTVEADSMTFSKYAWKKIKGDQGIPGANGSSSYFHIKYSSIANPTSSSQMTETPSDYIGTYVDNNPEDSTDPKKYTWSRFRGQDGNQGEQGTPGINGKDGKTYYLHIKYSDNGTTFTSNNGETPGAWLGQYVDTTEADSTVFSRYTWAKIKGDDGANASYVNITASNQVFLLEANATAYTPSSIKLTPTWTNSTYTKWQYSTDNGNTWTDVTNGNNGLTISNGVLTIANTCSLFTDSIKTLQFKVIGSNNTYDIMTIIRIKNGVNGANGTSATTIQLSNEAHIFQATSNGKAIASSIIVNIYGYVGATQKAVAIGTPTDVPTGMTITPNNSNSTSANLTIAVNTSMTTKNGVVTIPLTCNGKTFNKKFSYSLAIPGTNGTNASYVTASASSLFFKCGANSTTYNPSSIKITPTLVNCSYSKWQYSVDGGNAWTDVTSGSNGLTISSNALTIANSSSLYTSSVTSISFKVIATNSSNAQFIDVITISKLKDGNTGQTGKGIKSVTNYYLATSSSSDVTASTSGWTTTVQSISTTNKYLWNYELITYTDNSTYTTTPTIIGVHGTNGTNGANGKGIKSIAEYYVLSTTNSGVTTSTAGWSTTVPTLTSTNKYLWNYEKITYTDNSTTSTTPAIIGVYGDKGNTGAAGKDSINVILGNENHTFAASSNGAAVAGSTSTTVIGYKGTTLTACTVGTISGLPTGMTATISNNGTTTASIKFEVTTSLTTKSGSVTIPVTCGGVTINKYFSYSLAVAGTNGSSAKSIKINATTNVFKSTDGGVTFSPSSISLTSAVQNVSFSKWQYSADGSSFTNVTSGSHGLTVNGSTLVINVTSDLFTATNTTLAIRAVSSTSTVYDTLTVYKLYDRTDINDAFEEMELTVTQSNTKWEAAFKNSNANNLFLNSDAKTGTVDNWIDNGGGLSISKAQAFPFYSNTENYFKTSFPKGMRYAHDIQLEPNTDYVYEGYIYVNASLTGTNVTPLDFWVWTGSTFTQTRLCTIVDYRQTMTKNKFVKCYVHFKTNNVTEALYGRFFVYHTGTASLVGAKRMSLKKGTVETEWTQHPNEVKSSVVSIDETGVNVKHSDIDTTTNMSAKGFSITDSSSGDVLAWLSSKEQWTELKVDKVFANNIENIYTGESNLYVNHSFTGECKGTESNPFNSFTQLAIHLQSACIINKDINIYILTTASEITESFTLYGLKGTGVIRITYDGKCIHRIRESGGWCLKFVGIYNAISINGGRSNYNSDDGAILCDAGNSNGMSFTDCRNVEVNYININCKGTGINALRSNVRGRRIDFCDTYRAYDIWGQSVCSDNDGVGNCTDFFALNTGSIFTYGDNGGGYRPMGNRLEINGKYFLIGNERNATVSFRTKPPVPPVNSQVYTYTYNWTSHKTYQYQWSNWNDSDCKQGSWGNLSPYVKKLA